MMMVVIGQAGGRTIAVIGTPLDRAYPAEHASLQQAIYRDHLLLSPFRVGAHTGGKEDVPRKSARRSVSADRNRWLR